MADPRSLERKKHIEQLAHIKVSESSSDFCHPTKPPSNPQPELLFTVNDEKFLCNLCTRKPYDRIGNLKTHLKNVHNKVLEFKCF